jgi:hypothetical protein
VKRNWLLLYEVPQIELSVCFAAIAQSTGTGEGF